jgi:hypothetical protein
LARWGADAVVCRVTLGSRIRNAATSHSSGAQPRWCPLASRAGQAIKSA